MEKINIITLGNCGVGKTSLLYRYAKGKFKEHKHTFIERYIRPIGVNGQSIDVWLWDTSGQESFRSLIRDYYRLADGVLLVYSVNNFKSCKELQSWLSEFRSVNNWAKIVVVGNMSDLAEDPAKRSEEGIEIVRQLIEGENLDHAEVSAKTNKNVDDTMQYLIERISVAQGILDDYNRPDCVTSSSSEETGLHEQETDSLSSNQQSVDDQTIHLVAEKKQKKRCCCY